MSHHPPTPKKEHASALERGFEPHRKRSGFPDPVEPLDGQEETDHFALVYESRAEQFATVVPFLRQGLERGERCMYIVDDTSRDEVIAALRADGVDVDAALEAGQLSFHTVAETYLADGEFDLDEARSFLEHAMERSLEAYEGFRVTAEETWLVGDEATQNEFMACEAHVNELIDGEESTALCQYNRDRLPPAVIDDVIQTHPYLVYDSTVCGNVYYSPPAEYFGPDRPSRDNERKLRTLVDRTEARATLETDEWAKRQLYAIVADANRSFEEKVRHLLELGCERFGLEIGYVTRTDDDDGFEIVEAVGDHDRIEAGVTDSLCDTYCEKLLASPGPISVTDAAEAGWTDDPAYERYGLEAYFATTVRVGGEEYGTLCFGSETVRDRPYSDAERTYLDLMGQWLSYELEHQRRERFLRESYEITSDPARSFAEKLEHLLELGCERFGFEMGGLNHLPSWDGDFRLEMGVGIGADAEEGLLADPGAGCFCRETIAADEPVAMADVRGTDWADDRIHREHGLTSYLGTKVSSGSTPYGTLWFGGTEPRERPFSDDERTFIELMGQWVGYEIERRKHRRFQEALYEITADGDLSFGEKTERLLDLGRERFDLEMGFLLERQGDEFRVVKTRGTPLEEGTATLCANPDHYCKRTITLEGPVGVEDAEAVGWDDDPLYRDYDLGCYLGTRVTDGDDVYGSVCFADDAARDHEFTDAEYAFLDLIGQWLSYELERDERERRLERSNDRLEESNERLEQFAYAASHDLQEPLRMVSSYLQLLEGRYGDQFDADGEEFLAFAVDGADRMRDMIDGLLQYSRVETGGEPLERVDLDRVFESVRTDLQVCIEESNAEITADSLPQVRGDASQLRQVFQNLLRNAITYSGDEPPRVHVDAERRGREWVISVRDEGIGIPPGEQERIFDIFDRLHGPEEYDGTGIGLALCERIVERHGGELWVDSEPGEGSTFSFTLQSVAPAGS